MAARPRDRWWFLLLGALGVETGLSALREATVLRTTTETALRLTLDLDGTGSYDFTTTLVTLSQGATTLYDADGTSLMIHANADDYKTDPSGNSGDRIACGVISKASAKGK